MTTALLKVLTRTSFLEKALLLVLAAALTGIIVPIVKYRMDQNKFQQQKIFEAEVARQAEIMQARAQFLRDLANPIWQYQLLALQVSYDTNSEEAFSKALRTYNESSWAHLKRIRALVGGARWFTSDNTYQLLLNFIDNWLIQEIDYKLMRLASKGMQAEWRKFNGWLYAESRHRTDALLVALAQDFGLSPETSTQRLSPKITVEQ